MKRIIILVFTLIILLSFPVSAKTVARERGMGYTIKVTQKRGKTRIYWNGKLIRSYRFSGKVKIVSERKLTEKKLLNRKGKVLYIERVKGTVVSRRLDGRTSNGGYIKYHKPFRKGDRVVSYFVYNPFTHWIDDVHERYDAFN